MTLIVLRNYDRINRGKEKRPYVLQYKSTDGNNNLIQHYSFRIVSFASLISFTLFIKNNFRIRPVTAVFTHKNIILIGNNAIASFPALYFDLIA